MDIPPQPFEPKSSPPSFCETTAARPWMRVGGVFILVAAVVVAVVVLRGTFHEQAGAAVGATLSAALGIVIGIFGIINRITLEVDTQQVTLGFWPIWQRKILRDDIEELSAVDLDPARFGGLGLRRVPGRTWGLLFTGGPGLAVSRKSDHTTYYIRTDHSSEAIAAFRSIQPASPG